MTTADADMLDELDQEPVIAEAWIPENEGDTIIGIVESVSTREGEHGDYTIVTIQTDDGELLAVHGFGMVLAGHLDKDRPQTGDRYAIRYAGERGSKNGRTYKDWRTAIRRGPFITPDEPTPPPAKSATSRAKKKAAPAPADEKPATVDADGIEF